MAKVVKAKKIAKAQIGDYKHFLIPSVAGGVIAWIFSGSLLLGIVVFVAVWIGDWIGYSLQDKK